MPGITVNRLSDLARQGASISFYHGTDMASAVGIEQNGVSAIQSQALGGSGDFWATDDVSEAKWFAQVNPAGSQAAMFEFQIGGLLTAETDFRHATEGPASSRRWN